MLPPLLLAWREALAGLGWDRTMVLAVQRPPMARQLPLVHDRSARTSIRSSICVSSRNSSSKCHRNSNSGNHRKCYSSSSSSSNSNSNSKYKRKLAEMCSEPKRQQILMLIKLIWECQRLSVRTTKAARS
jgi:hypothetical protein